jgi:hypothetical protein
MLAKNIFRDILREETEFRYHFYYVRCDRALTMFDGIARIPPRLCDKVTTPRKCTKIIQDDF